MNQNRREAIAMRLEDGEPLLDGLHWHAARLLGLTMPRAPVLNPREVAAILERPGFTEVRQCGSHKQYRHQDGRR